MPRSAAQRIAAAVPAQSRSCSGKSNTSRPPIVLQLTPEKFIEQPEEGRLHNIGRAGRRRCSRCKCRSARRAKEPSRTDRAVCWLSRGNDVAAAHAVSARGGWNYSNGIGSHLVHGSTPRRSSSPSTTSKAISSGNTASVVQPMIAARVRIKKGVI